tara:strand:- start:100 stop:276 length:177 start_codon:yes stop_codon:yes gene_type:complete
MENFSGYKTYSNNSNTDVVDNWENNYNAIGIRDIPRKTIIKTITYFFKYGNMSKRIFI